MRYTENFDVIVCGAGHAGCEAAAAAARIGAKTLLITGNLDNIAKMSCNPAIGGLAKGNIVREIDALGGEIGTNTDASAIQFKLLNRSKGQAVQGPRAQCDKLFYQTRMKYILEKKYENLTLFQAIVDDIIVEDSRVIGIKTNIDIDFYGTSVVLTNGTFLRGIMHIGLNQTEGGRLGDFSAKHLSGNLKKYGIEIARMKTGTPARILGSSIDFSKCEEQPGDFEPCLFGFYDTREEDFFDKMFKNFTVSNSLERALLRDGFSGQSPCWITYTNDDTREIILKNLDRSPLYSGVIEGVGPRYCPSIEDKYVKFPDKNSHRLFLEPEGIFTNEWYINGLSTSLPFDVQREIIATIPGLEHAKAVRPAYAVEYDYAPPTQINSTLESKIIENLFFAGQINGTSGYEEAAGQGLVAGTNAAQKSKNEKLLTLGRHQSYIGVLIDDLVTKGTIEPYRMFTSRAEYRLSLNHNSSDTRLLPIAKEFGLIDHTRAEKTQEKINKINSWISQLEVEKSESKKIADALRQGHEPTEIKFPANFLNESQSIKDEVIYRITYAGYLNREARIIDKMSDIENVSIPNWFEFTSIKGLRNESIQKLQKFKPLTLGQVSRISGISPADLNLVWVAIERQRQSK